MIHIKLRATAMHFLIPLNLLLILFSKILSHFKNFLFFSLGVLNVSKALNLDSFEQFHKYSNSLRPTFSQETLKMLNFSGKKFHHSVLAGFTSIINYIMLVPMSTHLT